jgi:hypothetical protein
VTDKDDKHWHILQAVELGAPAKEVWEVVGGFFTIHGWHPDIAVTEVIPDQVETAAIRRRLTFPGQPKTTEELVFMDNENFRCHYKWHAGSWGEMVRNYVAEIKVFDISMEGRCVVQWSSEFDYTEDAVSEFYWNGFRALQERFPLPES